MKKKACIAGVALACTLFMCGGAAVAYADEAVGELSPAGQEIKEMRANNHDTVFQFTLKYAGATAGTEGREKEDDSSVYIYIDSLAGRAPRMFVDGSTSLYGGWVDCTQGTYYGSKYGEYEIYNEVNENGYTAARLTSWAESSSGSVWGLWSPDCVGHFPRL